MTRSAWTTFALVSFGFSGFLAGCVVTSGDGSGGVGNFGGSGNAGGDTSTGGTGTAGAATGGSGNSATGGTAGAGPTVACDPGVSTPLPQCDTTVTDVCMACLADKCCVSFAACFGTNPGDRCGFGGPTGTGEFQCLRDCVASPAQYGCDTSVDPIDIQQCCAGSACATPSCGTSFVGDTTSNLMTCINDTAAGNPCATECGFL